MSSPEHEDRGDDNKQDELDDNAGEPEQGLSRPLVPFLEALGPPVADLPPPFALRLDSSCC